MERPCGPSARRRRSDIECHFVTEITQIFSNLSKYICLVCNECHFVTKSHLSFIIDLFDLYRFVRFLQVWSVPVGRALAVGDLITSVTS